MTWVKTVPLADLLEKPVVFKKSPKQVALFHLEGRVYAVDNRCPHEGYPLAEGTVDDQCMLTCNWHNWKFRLSDGECLLGGDHVRAYAAEVRDGDVWLNLADPPREETQRQILRGLKTAFEKREFDRICREITRLTFNEFDPMVAVREAIHWSHDRLEFGTTHAFAATADWLAMAAASDDWEHRLICLAESVDHMAFDAQRHPVYAYAPPGKPFHRESFQQAVEAEDRLAAEGMVRQGLADGLHWADMERAFTAAALAHYNDFGHSLIYVYKTGQLVELLGEEVEAYLLPALARHLCYTTREDLIPEFKEYAGALAAMPEPALDGDASDLAPPFPSSTRDALSWVVEQSDTHSVPQLYDALLEASSRNMLHYDTSYGEAYDRPVSQNVGWLDFTHGITFANATRRQCEKFPRLWRQALLQMACFIGRNRRYLDLDVAEADWFVEDQPSFFAELDERVLDHGLRDPIFSAHLLKTTKAVEEELPRASKSCRRYLLAGLNRFTYSPIKQKHVRRLARQAIDLVKRDFA